MEMVVVGSGTAAPDSSRVGSAYFVSVGMSRVLLDCGPGAVHHLAQLELPWPDLTHLCISHFHTDHICDVPALLFAFKYGQPEPRTQPFTIYGPAGTRKLFRRLAAAFGDYIKDPGFPIEIIELKPGKRIPLNDVAHISVAATPHTDSSIAYRIDGPQSSFGYTGDTDHDVDLGAFLQALDLLVIECSLPDELGMAGHMTPSRVATFARVALPRRILLTHMYPQMPRSAAVELVKKAGWDGEVLLAEDGLRLDVLVGN
jgi:ribonuclease BN (tRNA processing enzyme)